MSSTTIDPHDPPAIVEVFSNSARAWFVALVVSIKDETLVLRFINQNGAKLQKLASCRDPRVVSFGTHSDGILPPGVSRVASNTRPGEYAYLYTAVQRKFGTPALAWQAYLERELLEGQVPCLPGSPTNSEVPLQRTPQSAASSSDLAAIASALPVPSSSSSSPFERASDMQEQQTSPQHGRALEAEFAKLSLESTNGSTNLERIQEDSKLIRADTAGEKAQPANASAPPAREAHSSVHSKSPVRLIPLAPKVEEIDFGFSHESRLLKDKAKDVSGVSAAAAAIDGYVQPEKKSEKVFYTVGYAYPGAKSKLDANMQRVGDIGAATNKSRVEGSLGQDNKSFAGTRAEASAALKASLDKKVSQPSGKSAALDIVAACAAEAARAADMARSIAEAVTSKVIVGNGALIRCKTEALMFASLSTARQAEPIDIVQPGTILMAAGGMEVVNRQTFVSIVPRGFVQLDCFEEHHDPRLAPPELEPPKFDFAYSALVIWLHGLNGSSIDWVPWQNALKKRLPWVQFCFPDAVLRPMSCQRGHCMQAWFDMPQLPVTDSDKSDGMEKSIAMVHRLMSRARMYGFPTSRILLGGLSQGATLALQVGLTYERSIAGVCALSGWVPQSLLHKMCQVDVPIFMGHGDQDQVAPMALAQRSAECLAQAGCTSVRFMKYRGLQHAFVTAELDDVEEFFRIHLPMRPTQKT